jgi:hypothetical protein
MNIIEFMGVMKKMSMIYFKQFDEETVKIWYEFLKDEKKDVLENAINEIIKSSKFFPNVAQVLEECKIQQKLKEIKVLYEMKEANYFKNGEEYIKALNFINERNIPQWLKNDMNNYYSRKLLN